MLFTIYNIITQSKKQYTHKKKVAKRFVYKIRVLQLCIVHKINLSKNTTFTLRYSIAVSLFVAVMHEACFLKGASVQRVTPQFFLYNN